MPQQLYFLKYLIFMCCLLCWSAVGLAQLPSSNTQETIRQDSEIQKIEITSVKHKQTMSYQSVQNLWNKFRDQVKYEPREIDSVLLAHPNIEAKEGFYVFYIDADGKENIIEVGKYGVLNLPTLPTNIAKNLILEMHSKNKLTSIIFSPHFTPRINGRKRLDYESYNKFITQTNKAINDVSWHVQLLYMGKLKAKANGIHFCFSEENAYLEIEGTQILAAKNNCITHRINQEFLNKKPEIIINGNLEFATMLFEN